MEKVPFEDLGLAESGAALAPADGGVSHAQVTTVGPTEGPQTHGVPELGFESAQGWWSGRAWPWLDQPTTPSPRTSQVSPGSRAEAKVTLWEQMAWLPFPPGLAGRTEPGVYGCGQQEAGAQSRPSQALSA